MDPACPMLASPEFVSPFLQILGLGFVWTFLHCSPMCGPIISGLRLGEGARPISAWKGLLLYQCGRGIVYGIAGGLAGLFGAEIFSNPKYSWGLVFILGLFVIVQAFPNSLKFSVKIPQSFSGATRLISNLTGARRAFFFGVLFAFLPCLLAFWALTVAASTKTFWRGAAVMLLLILMTTLPLLLFSVSSRRFFKGQQYRVTLILLLISFSWTLLVTLAANEMISHRHLTFEVWGTSYTMMFW